MVFVYWGIRLGAAESAIPHSPYLKSGRLKLQRICKIWQFHVRTLLAFVHSMSPGTCCMFEATGPGIVCRRWLCAEH